MPRVELVRESTIRKTGRALQLASLFDVQPDAGRRVEWALDVPLDERPWSIGLIVGPSGSGKTTVARHLFGERVVTGYEWAPDTCLLDGFPADMPTDTASGFLSAVGFGSVPEWLRPFHVLSTGQQFRATLARALAENAGLVCADEFTSVVDRQVAQVCAAAVSKAVRRMERQFVAVTCHYDVEAWLDPDWVLDLGDAQRPFDWRSLRGRPPIEITLVRAVPSAWDLFKNNHYLAGKVSFGCICYLATCGGTPVAFIALLRDFLNSRRGGDRWRISRVVVNPEWQGVGVGVWLCSYLAGCWKASGRAMSIVTGHRGMIRALTRSGHWRCSRGLSTTKWYIKEQKFDVYRATDNARRLTASFVFTGPAVEAGPLEWP